MKKETRKNRQQQGGQVDPIAAHGPSSPPSKYFILPPASATITRHFMTRFLPTPSNFT